MRKYCTVHIRYILLQVLDIHSLQSVHSWIKWFVVNNDKFGRRSKHLTNRKSWFTLIYFTLIYINVFQQSVACVAINKMYYWLNNNSYYIVTIQLLRSIILNFEIKTNKHKIKYDKYQIVIWKLLYNLRKNLMRG